jgi:hypothetical protein
MAEIVEIEGLERVRKALLEAPKHLRQKVMHSILRKAAAPILRQARANAPQAKKSTKYVIPGLIKKTLGITRSKLRSAARGEFGVFITARIPGKVKRLRRSAKVAGARGPYFGDPYYHRFQEGGFHATGGHKIKGGKRSRAERLSNLRSSGAIRYIEGKAYLGNAYLANRMNAVKIMSVETAREVIAAFERRAKK